jgi:flagellar protein FlaI
MAETKVLDTYNYKNEGIPVVVTISRSPTDFVPFYEVKIPGISDATRMLLETKLKAEVMSKVEIDITDILDPKKEKPVRDKFYGISREVLQNNFPNLTKDKEDILATYLVQHSLGLGQLEVILADDTLEEMVINGSSEPVWVYHKRFGWSRTNVKIKDEDTILNYSSLIARRIGRQINVLNPLLDAHISSGDRVNSTLFPISSFGNTITIRKFAKNPWTASTIIANGTCSTEIMALIWLSIQNELSLLVSGGTGSGKTSFLNAIAGFIPANHRVISIEDTRELTLPRFLQWVPLVTREANPEGKGEISMLDLLVNSLRMRPDRILVGEVRRQREAEILFEAMHTGHSVYATLHADDANQTISRLTTPPINLPKEVLDALAGIVVQLRHRRFNIRRCFEFSEVKRMGELNTIYRWDSKKDTVNKIGELERIADMLELYAGLTPKEINQDLKEKVAILNWTVDNKYFEVDQVGNIVSTYYDDPELVMEYVNGNKKWEFGES